MDNLSSITKSNALSVLTLKQAIDNLKKEYEIASETLLKEMIQEGLSEIEIKKVGKITLKEASERLITDTKRLQSVYSDIYNDCVKVSPVKAHLVVKA